MATAAPTELDHVGFGVQDLSAAAERFRALGFTLTPLAEHTKRGPDGRAVSAGSGQYSAMFEQGYIELLGVTDPNARHVLSERIARYSGIHHVLFGVESAELASMRLRSRGIPTDDPKEWERPVTHGALVRTARFHFFALPLATTPEGLLGYVEQRTPDVIRPPGTQAHANGALALAGVVVCSVDAAALAARYSRYLERAAVEAGGGFVIALDRGQELCFVNPATFASLFAPVMPPASHYFAACVIRVKDLAQARQCVSASGALVHEWQQGFWIQGDLVLGGTIAFAE